MRAPQELSVSEAAPDACPAETPIVAVYREAILHYNEPYIRTQAEAVPRYTSWYVGTHRVAPAVDLPRERTLVLRDRYRPFDGALDKGLCRLPVRGSVRHLARGGVVGRAAENLFIRTGVSPYLDRRLRALGPAVLHAHTGVSGAHALPLARRLGVPLVVTFHGYDATANDDELRRWPLRGRIFLKRREAMKRECARFIAVSGFIRDLLLAKQRAGGARRRPLHGRRHHALQTGLSGRAAFRARAHRLLRRAAHREEGTRIPDRRNENRRGAHPGSAGRYRGARRAAASAGAAGRRGPGQRALHRSSNPRRGARVDGTCAAVLHAERPGVRASGRPGVRAADGDGEGLPTALVEAMACGLPVVATTHAGVPEAVRHGETGLLAPERDVAALAEHLIAVLDNRVLRERMGLAARAPALERFDHRRQAAKLAAIYDEVRAERGALRADGTARASAAAPRRPR